MGLPARLATSLVWTVPLAAQPAESRGLILEVTPRGAGAVADVRVARMVALHVKAGAPVTPFVGAGPFTAHWRGELQIDARDRFTFSLEGSGDIAVHIDDRPVELGVPVRLSRGRRRLLVDYTSPSQGDAQVRLLWAGRSFPAEPVPPTVLYHDAANPELQRQSELRRGRELWASRNCLKCHALPDGMVGADGLPELEARPPDLESAGARLRRGWLECWVLAPRSLRSGAKMPHVLSGDGAATDARDIAAYLAGLGDAPPAPEFSAEEVALGGQWFAQLGCIGCHDRPDAARDDPARVPLRWVAAKWHGRALVEFLLEPDRHNHWTAMPDFGLSPARARQLAAWIVETAAPAPLASTGDGDAARGARLVQTLGCARCHPSLGPSSPRAPGFEDLAHWDRGCLAADPTTTSAPDFGLDPSARVALRAAGQRADSFARHVPSEFASRQLAALNCNACHTIDRVADRWSRHASEVEDLLAGVEEPALAQSRPNLTWAGEKLRSDFIAELLTGSVSPRSRPWLVAAMPAFKAYGPRLAAGMAATHGLGTAVSDQPPDRQAAAIGKQLIGATGGFACTMCHALAGTPPTAVFEVQGIDFAATATRLRKPYFVRWLLNPLRIDPASRMPKYADDRGKTAFTDVLGGDATRQFDAIWQYLMTLRDRG